MAADAFIYHDGNVVPWDVIRAVVHPSVRVLPPGAFRNCTRLEEVRLHRGLEEIGDEAFYGCDSLGLLDCPPTVVRIGRGAFRCCRTLEEVRLNEGLETMGDGAFIRCASLRRLDCPSTVVRIGRGAFRFCWKLEEVRLHEGLEEIGDGAFMECVSLGRLDCPSTVVRIGDMAFRNCRKLSAVELAGIIQVGSFAFFGCNYMLRITSSAFVAPRGIDGLITNGITDPTYDPYVLIAHECLSILPESNLTTELWNSIGTIMNSGEGTDEDRIERVRQEVRKEFRGEVSAILGLAFWKANIDEAERTGIRAAKDRHKNKGLRKRAKVSVVLNREAREGCRGPGKGKLIAENVLPFLDRL